LFVFHDITSAWKRNKAAPLLLTSTCAVLTEKIGGLLVASFIFSVL
jgi:hypothetical protein